MGTVDINTKDFGRKIRTGKKTQMKMPSIERWNKFQVNLSEGRFKKTTFPLKSSLMANHKDCKNRGRILRQKCNNL